MAWMSLGLEINKAAYNITWLMWRRSVAPMPVIIDYEQSPSSSKAWHADASTEHCVPMPAWVGPVS